MILLTFLSFGHCFNVFRSRRRKGGLGHSSAQLVSSLTDYFSRAFSPKTVSASVVQENAGSLLLVDEIVNVRFRIKMIHKESL